MTIGQIISGFRPVSLLMTQVWFNFNQVFNGYRFMFSNSKRIQVLLLYVKNGKMLIKIINYHKGSEKPKKLSRSRMTKQTAPLNSSREI